MIQYNLGLALRAAYLTMHQKTGERLKPTGITPEQFVCLAVLDEHPGITQQELAQRIASDPNTVRAILVLLEKSGHILRVTHPTDRRAYQVSLTRKGKTTIQKLLTLLKPVRESMISLFNEKETADLYHHLTKISNELDN